MSNNTFFDNFLKKDKLFNYSQKNPNFKKDWWGTRFQKGVTVRFLDAAGARKKLLKTPYNKQVRFYPNVPGLAAGRVRIRLPPFAERKTIDFAKKDQTNFLTSNTMYWKPRVLQIEDPTYPARGAVLPSALNYAAADMDARIEANQEALLAGKAFFVERVQTDIKSGFEGNYWFPDYQGKYTNLESKMTKHIPHPYYDKDASFLPKNFMSPKGKEAYIWLKAGNYDYHRFRPHMYHNVGGVQRLRHP